MTETKLTRPLVEFVRELMEVLERNPAAMVWLCPRCKHILMSSGAVRTRHDIVADREPGPDISSMLPLCGSCHEPAALQ
jgi:hypothetical protein